MCCHQDVTLDSSRPDGRTQFAGFGVNTEGHPLEPSPLQSRLERLSIPLSEAQPDSIAAFPSPTARKQVSSCARYTIHITCSYAGLCIALLRLVPKIDYSRCEIEIDLRLAIEIDLRLMTSRLETKIEGRWRWRQETRQTVQTLPDS